MDRGDKELNTSQNEARNTGNTDPPSTTVYPSDSPSRDSFITPDAGLLEFLHASNAIPSLEQGAQLKEVLLALRKIVGASEDGEAQRGSSERADIPDAGPMRTARSAVKLVLVLVGSAAMGVDLPGSDLDCVVVGNVNTATFGSSPSRG